MSDRVASLARFAAAHSPGRLLFVANAWDAASAAVLADAGADAIGTSSAAAAWALGSRDGDPVSTGEVVAHVARIARAVACPLTVDLEDGYSDDPRDMVALVAEVASAGACGVNLEDRSAAPEILARKVAAIRASGVPVFVSARTDVVLHPRSDARPIEEATRRALVYERAGADAFFVPGLAAIRDVAAIAGASALPLHLMVVPGLPPLAELRAAGVRRVSAGPRFYQVALTAARRALVTVRDGGRVDALLDFDVAYAWLQEHVARPPMPDQ